MKTKEDVNVTDNKEETGISYLNEEDKRELVFQWLAREWSKENL